MPTVRNSRTDHNFGVANNSVAFIRHTVKGKQTLRFVTAFASGSKSKNRLAFGFEVLKVQYGFLTQVNKQQPFIGHSIGSIKNIYFV